MKEFEGEEAEEGEGEEEEADSHVNDEELYKVELIILCDKTERERFAQRSAQGIDDEAEADDAEHDQPNYRKFQSRKVKTNENRFTHSGNHIISRKLSSLEHFYDEKDPNAKPIPVPKSDFVYDYSYSNSDYIPQDDMEEEEEEMQRKRVIQKG